jgi:hypothetical protein
MTNSTPPQPYTEDRLKNSTTSVDANPDRASVTTCGPKDQPTRLWLCRLLEYGDQGYGHDLIIYEQNIGGAWYVNSWIAH